MSERRLLGYVEVDSGTLLIGDPGYVLPWKERGSTGVDYQTVIDATAAAGSIGGKPVLLLQQIGGDGTFPVYGEFEDEELISATVEFDPPEDD